MRWCRVIVIISARIMVEGDAVLDGDVVLVSLVAHSVDHTEDWDWIECDEHWHQRYLISSPAVQDTPSHPITNASMHLHCHHHHYVPGYTSYPLAPSAVITRPSKWLLLNYYNNISREDHCSSHSPHGQPLPRSITQWAWTHTAEHINTYNLRSSSMSIIFWQPVAG